MTKIEYVAIYHINMITIKHNLLKLFPTQIDENEFSALLKLISLLENKNDVIKVEEDEYNSLFNYGRDRTDKVLTSLVQKKYITREQKRDQTGKFTYNEIRIITDLIK